MTMTLDPNTNTRPARRSNGTAATSAAQRLRLNFAAVRVCFTWFGVRKALSAEQKAQAAESFGAETAYFQRRQEAAG